MMRMKSQRRCRLEAGVVKGRTTADGCERRRLRQHRQRPCLSAVQTLALFVVAAIAAKFAGTANGLSLVPTKASSFLRFDRASRSTSQQPKLPYPESLGGMKMGEEGGASAASRAVDSSPKTVVVATAEELRQKVLDEGVVLASVEARPGGLISGSDRTAAAAPAMDHRVLQLLSERRRTKSKPGQRDDNDKARLALCIEGGGMRGAVSAGMAAAISCLGLADAFDTVYGSSAGSVIGAYLVSRQMPADVYDMLCHAGRSFICRVRGVSTLAMSPVYGIVSKLGSAMGRQVTPGMNVSFVLDNIMHHSTGVRPLDIEAFRENNKKQPLRVVASSVGGGKAMETKCFGTDDFDNAAGVGGRKGLYACLEASMSVPGATGPPIQISNVGNNKNNNETLFFCDAFCTEPVPYRSAVEEGATHVLALCSRPENAPIQTKPGLYELGVAPLHFLSHGHPEVAKFFALGGQNYIYAEDLLTLAEAKKKPSTTMDEDGVVVPPPTLLHGIEQDEAAVRLAFDRSTWKRSHLLPIQVPPGTPELATMEQDRDTVLEAVRTGFATAFDLLAPAAGLELGGALDGRKVAEIAFPDEYEEDNATALEQLLHAGQTRRTRWRGVLGKASSRVLRLRRSNRKRVPEVV